MYSNIYMYSICYYKISSRHLFSSDLVHELRFLSSSTSVSCRHTTFSFHHIYIRYIWYVRTQFDKFTLSSSVASNRYTYTHFSMTFSSFVSRLLLTLGRMIFERLGWFFISLSLSPSRSFQTLPCTHWESLLESIDNSSFHPHTKVALLFLIVPS